MAQFVEVDKTSGTYVLNSDKKVTATDYVIHRSREELLKVSPIDRDRFLNEMEVVNSQLSAISARDWRVPSYTRHSIPTQ